MKPTTTKKTHTIDAKGKSLGRVASQAAALLMGKNLVEFTRHKSPIVHVTITNASKIKITEKKLDETKYLKYSGYQGGLKIESLTSLSARRGFAEGVKRAVKGMIPNNKLRPEILKSLTITE